MEENKNKVNSNQIEEEEKIFKSIGQEVFCHFKTNLVEKYKIDDSQQYAMKTEFNEKDLSEQVKAILSEENPELEEKMGENFEKISFQFLINGEFLRGNIKSHLLKHKLSSETTITIYYTFGIQKPNEDKKSKEEDWISHLQLLNEFNLNKQSPFVASLFSGDLAFYDQNQDLILRENIIDGSIKQTLCQPMQTQTQKGVQNYITVSACSDETIRVGQLSYAKNKKDTSFKLIAECNGNESTVSCIDVNPLKPYQYCSGSYTGDLSIYNISENNINQAENVYQNKENGKKVKQDLKVIEPIQQSKALHHDNISRCLWKNQNQIYTSSFDHSIKLYDTTKVAQVQSIATKDSAVTTFNFDQDLVISGHEDSYIKTFDMREGKGPVNIFKSHTLWVSDIQKVPINDHQFISCSYDHTIKLWDQRSQFPIFTLKSHHDKIFSVIWNGDSKILSGGSDKEIISHVFPSDPFLQA
ncbi:WD40-repeat-containing domain [Pseudocohnilembus persalinus]|uniref:WD40-repeat-containing domain n=1 Tax=Pseudocohnilembus persalinus TaxID=266149 RepID=A0A0V0QH86_PSEPJ|nr:WD40-repeat-containing domain [Pseudocohnilembus persalinus]|eukprot:KRX01534.1 WD40-repeat-containing domain [Pseudocohnilembus persalinus]